MVVTQKETSFGAAQQLPQLMSSGISLLTFPGKPPSAGESI